jgi:hypothetical protein
MEVGMGEIIVKSQTAPATPAATYGSIYEDSTDNLLKFKNEAGTIQTLGMYPNRNAIINGSFRVSQRGTAFTSATVPANSDDTYLLDRWILLSDGNDIVDVSQEQSATIADPAYNIKLDVETANKKFGILTVLEQLDSRQFINQTCSLSFKAKRTGTTIGAIRAAILSWSSTADTVTSDVVSAWEAAGTNPTLVANWNYENVPVALSAITTSWQTFKIEGIAIDTAASTNVGVFIWTDDTAMDVGDFLHIAEVQLEVGSVATAFEVITFADELALCQRYYERKIAGGSYSIFGSGYAASVTAGYFFVPHATKRVLPTSEVSAQDTFGVQHGESTQTASVTCGTSHQGLNGSWMYATTASVLAAAHGCLLIANNNAAVWIAFSAEL